MPLGGGGHVGADDGEVGQSLQGAPAAPGGALLDLDRADVSFRQVVRPGHGKIDHEPWNHSFVLAEPPRQPQRVAGGGSGAGGVVGDPRCGRAAVEVADPVEGGAWSMWSWPVARAVLACWFAWVRVSAIVAAQHCRSGSAVCTGCASWLSEVGCALRDGTRLWVPHWESCSGLSWRTAPSWSALPWACLTPGDQFGMTLDEVSHALRYAECHVLRCGQPAAQPVIDATPNDPWRVEALICDGAYGCDSGWSILAVLGVRPLHYDQQRHKAPLRLESEPLARDRGFKSPRFRSSEQGRRYSALRPRPRPTAPGLSFGSQLAPTAGHRPGSRCRPGWLP